MKESLPKIIIQHCLQDMAVIHQTTIQQIKLKSRYFLEKTERPFLTSKDQEKIHSQMVLAYNERRQKFQKRAHEEQ